MDARSAASRPLKSLADLPKAYLADAPVPARVRFCVTPLGLNPHLAGLKTLNRLESVLARATKIVQ